MSYEPPVLSKKHGFGDAKASEASTRLVQARLIQGEKPVNGLTKPLPEPNENGHRQDFKLLIDPAIKKGHSKIYRYNGVFPGQLPVVPKDPRSRRTRIWALNKADLPVPNFKVDKWYVGIPPQREVYFSGLNDNVDKKFLEGMCERYGKVDAIKIYFDPQTKKHTGKGRVTFASTGAAKLAVAKLDHTSVMGNIIKAHIESNIKGAEGHGRQRVAENPPRRNSGHDSSISVQLPTPSPTILSQSSSADSSLLSPSLLLMKSPASSVRLPNDIWGTSLGGSWDKTSVSGNKLSQSGSAFISPQSVSSVQSGFEPVSPPHNFTKNNEPPPPPPPVSKPPPLPVDNKYPPAPANQKSRQPSSYMNYEDISPDPIFSPGEDEREKTDLKIMTKKLESCKRDSKHSSSSPSRARSPRFNRNESYLKWEKKKQDEREEKYREKAKEFDRHNGGSDRDSRCNDDRRLDYKYKHDGCLDKRDYYRREDYDRNRPGARYDKDDYKHAHRKERYSLSPRRDEFRYSDHRDSKTRDPRLRDKENEGSGGRDPPIKDVKFYDRGQRGEDGSSRDPRLRGKTVEVSDVCSKVPKAAPGLQEKRSSLESKDVGKSELRKTLSESVPSLVDGQSYLCDSKSKDASVKELLVKVEKSICHSKEGECKGSGEKPGEDVEIEGEQEDNTSCSVEPDSNTAISAAEIISSVVSGSSLSKTYGPNKYSEDAYTVGVETYSDEEPLPPGDEYDVAHEVQLDIARSKIKAAQNAVKKRKFSETVEDEKKSSGPKSKKIQIVLKSVQLNETEGDLLIAQSLDSNSKQEESEGGWSNVSPKVVADVAVECEQSEVSTSRLANLPLTEDISPCNSPAVETTSHIECSSELTSKEPASIDIYSDIEGNEDDQCVVDVNNDDNDDAMSLSSISSNEDTLEVNEPDLPKTESISVPPPSVVFPPYPPPMFNPSIPPPPFFNPRVPPPPLVPVTVPPPPIPAHPSVPPPSLHPPLNAGPILPPTVPPPPPAGTAVPIPRIPPPIIGSSSGFYDPRVPPPISCGSYHSSGGFAYQKQEYKKPWRAVIIDEVYRNICGELDTVLKRDMFKKLVEASAFKALESWWDNKTKPKTVLQTTGNSSRNLPPASTAGISSNLGAGASTIGPSPFERSPSMLLGLRASLPKLPSFKVKRTPEVEKVVSGSRKRSNTESSEVLERQTKKQILEEPDLELDAELENSSGSYKRLRLHNKLEEAERSQSPFQQLDDNVDVAPRATIVRYSEVEERRPSTGSSLYHKVYSSSSSESESNASESDDEEEEESEEEESQSESDTESEEETESESEEEKEEDNNRVIVTDLDVEHERQKELMMTEGVEKQPVDVPKASLSEASLDSLSAEDIDSAETESREPCNTTDKAALTETMSHQVDQESPKETYQGFHIANIVPDLFKDKDAAPEEGSVLSENEMEIGDKHHELSTELNVKTQTQDVEDKRYSQPECINTTILEKPFEKMDGNVITGDFKPPSIDSICEENELKSQRLDHLEEKEDFGGNEDDDFVEKRMPVLSPDKPLAVSLVELDHSYGLVAPVEVKPLIKPIEEADSKESHFDDDSRHLTESPVIDILNIDSEVVPSPQMPQFPVRSFESDDELVYEFHRLGIDAEDCYYMKVGFEQLQQVGSESVVDAHWIGHPPTCQVATKLRRKQKPENGVRVHVTGCARTEGFYRIDIKEKAKYLQAQRRQLQCQENVTKQELKTEGNKAKQQSREHRATQRRLQSAVCNEEFGDLLKFNQLMVRKKQLRFGKSGIHDWGLFAMESMAADEMVTEYVGEVIRQSMADIRERRYEEMGIGSSYLFRVDQETIIDATTKGNFARFINHSCDPNCYAKIVTLENAKKIVIYSKRDIEVNEEITYDYKFPIEDEKIPCLCGVPQCRGTLN